MLIDRPTPIERIHRAFSVHRVAALTGPRQCGKTTLAREIADRAEQSTYFDLEEPSSRRRLATPEQALGRLRGLVVIDGVQRSSMLVETVRILVDRTGNAARFLLVGSAAHSWSRRVSESLAGRVGLVDLGGLDLGEVSPADWRRLWLRGGFPRSYLASPDGSVIWRRNYVRTFLERDLPQLGITIPAERLRRFWTMIAHSHGQTWNAAELARSLGISEGTARNYLALFAGTRMVRLLPPWFENIRKRQVKSPKAYVRDTGILHTLLGLTGEEEVAGHPKVGASFEGFVIAQLLAAFDSRDACFWRTHGGVELALLVRDRGARFGFECQFADAPVATRRMRTALRDLALDHLWIVYPGEEAYLVDDRISVLPVSHIQDKARELMECRVENGRQWNDGVPFRRYI